MCIRDSLKADRSHDFDMAAFEISGTGKRSKSQTEADIITDKDTLKIIKDAIDAVNHDQVVRITRASREGC